MTENTSDKENRSVQANKPESHVVETIKVTDSSTGEKTLLDQNDNVGRDEISEEGWQEAFPKGRSTMSRKPSASKRPSLAKLNTNFLNAPSHPSKSRGKPSAFASPRTSPNESTEAPKKFVKSSSFRNGPSPPATGKEKSGNAKSAPATPSLATHEVAKASSIASSVSVHAAGKLFSYKEVALAPPGTIIKAVAEKNSAEENLQPIKEASKEEEKSVEIVKEVDNTAKEKELKLDDAVTGTKVETTVEKKEHDNGKESATSEGLDSTASKKEGTTDLETPPKSVESGASGLKEKEVEEEKKKSDSGNESESESVGVVKDEEENQANGSSIPSPTEGEKQVDSEIGKEPTKKLSAAAPPYTPTTVPVFGTIPLPGYTEHGGILPPPVNITPVLAVNPVRRSPHQSATARVPYGPRLSGGYNRSASRVPRNRPAFHNGENGDFNLPRIMNPHANEFVPGHSWVTSGYSVAPNGYIATQNGVPFSANGFPLSPNGNDGFPPLPNGTQNGVPVSSVDPADSPAAENAEVDEEEENEASNHAVEEDNVQEASSEATVIPSEVSQLEEKVDEETQCDQIVEDDSQLEGKRSDADVESPNVISPDDTSTETAAEGKTTKRWGDYSDGEAEVPEIAKVIEASN